MIKKIFYTLLLSFCLFSLTSCSKKDKKPVETETETEKVTESETSDEVLSTTEEVPLLSAEDRAILETAINKTNYTYLFTASYNNNPNVLESIHALDGQNYYQFDDVNGDLYLENLETSKKLYYTYDSKNYYVLEGDSYYETLKGNFVTVLLADLNLDKLLRSDDHTFTCTSESLDDYGRFFTTYYDKYTAFSFTLVDGLIANVTIKATSNYEGTTINYTYVYEFSDYGTTKVNLPTDAVLYESK